MLGTPELVRWGVSEADTPQIAALIARALVADQPESLIPEVKGLRRNFNTLKFICSSFEESTNQRNKI